MSTPKADYKSGYFVNLGEPYDQTRTRPRDKGRPMYARVVKDNIASLRVLEKCGFTICGEGKGFAYARGEEVEEFILRLKASEAGDVRDVEK